MKPIALGLALTVALSLPALAAEPDGPAELITQKEAVRIEIQGRLAGNTLSGTPKQVALGARSVPPLGRRERGERAGQGRHG
jgi:hypothetical protein